LYRRLERRLKRSRNQRTQNIFEKLFATVTTLSLAQTKIPLTEVYPLLCFGDVSASGAAVLYQYGQQGHRTVRRLCCYYVAMERFPYAEKYKKKS
jgi:hypothetical protein